jgi:hypothetical protein
VPPDVRLYFQRDIDRTKVATAERARAKLRREATAAKGNNPVPEAYDEEAELLRAMSLSRAEVEYQRGVQVQQRKGIYDLSGPILCPVLGSITPLFIPNSSIRLIRLIGLCVSLITFLYPPVPWIQFDPSTANSQFVESLRLCVIPIDLSGQFSGFSFFP